MDTTALRNAVAALESQLAASASTPQPTYTITTPQGGQTVDWTTYRAALVKDIAALREMINGYDPYIISTRNTV